MKTDFAGLDKHLEFQEVNLLLRNTGLIREQPKKISFLNFGGIYYE